jgi:plasmid maintenance system antidote protein VapI
VWLDLQQQYDLWHASRPQASQGQSIPARSVTSLAGLKSVAETCELLNMNRRTSSFF